MPKTKVRLCDKMLGLDVGSSLLLPGKLDLTDQGDFGLRISFALLLLVSIALLTLTLSLDHLRRGTWESRTPALTVLILAAVPSLCLTLCSIKRVPPPRSLKLLSNSKLVSRPSLFLHSSKHGQTHPSREESKVGHHCSYSCEDPSCEEGYTTRPRRVSSRACLCPFQPDVVLYGARGDRRGSLMCLRPHALNQF